MLILGIDPGATTGWTIYNSESRSVVDCGQFDGYDSDIGQRPVDAVILEQPKGQGPTRPQVVDCGIVFGFLLCDSYRRWGRDITHAMLRLDVKKVLTRATMNEVQVVNDSSAWAALKLLHGEGSDTKPTKKREGGAIGRVTSHERAALATAVAWAIQAGELEF